MQNKLWLDFILQCPILNCSIGMSPPMVGDMITISPSRWDNEMRTHEGSQGRKLLFFILITQSTSLSLHDCVFIHSYASDSYEPFTALLCLMEELHGLKCRQISECIWMNGVTNIFRTCFFKLFSLYKMYCIISKHLYRPSASWVEPLKSSDSVQGPKRKKWVWDRQRNTNDGLKEK